MMAGKFWNKGIMLVTGCSKVSAGCKNCWSEKQHVIRSTQKNDKIRNLYKPQALTNGHFNGLVQFNGYLLEKAVKVRRPTVYAIWNDLYHPALWKTQIEKAHRIMKGAPHHTFLIVTKRPENAARALLGLGPMPEHIWHIATCENQMMAAARIPSLLQIPGNLGIINEPALGPLDLSGWLYSITAKRWAFQVITGAETGPGARPMELSGARQLRDQCAAAGIPFYLKTLGAGMGRALDGVEHNELAWKEGMK